jgi:hypothetical protein
MKRSRFTEEQTIRKPVFPQRAAGRSGEWDRPDERVLSGRMTKGCALG